MSKIPVIPADAPPNSARIYDYTLGGTFHNQADREAAEYMYQLMPSTKKWVRMLRAFLQQAASELYQEGFTQFLDLGSGLPTQDHIHHVVPAARVVYVDREPLTAQYGRALVAEAPNAHYLEGDIRDIRGILDSPLVRQNIDSTQKVAIGLNGLLVFFDHHEVHALARALYDWAPSGSKIYVTYETKASDRSTPRWEAFIGMFAAVGAPFYAFSLEQNLAMIEPWHSTRVQPLAEYLGYPPGYVTEDDREGVELEFYAAILSKD